MMESGALLQLVYFVSILLILIWPNEILYKRIISVRRITLTFHKEVTNRILKRNKSTV